MEKREEGWGGRSQWVGKCSQISDSQEPSPQREAIMAGRGVGRSGGACQRAYWQSVSKSTGMRGGSFCPGTEKRLQEIRSRLSLGSSAMRDVWERRRWRGQQLTGQGSCGAEGKEFKTAFFCHRGDAPALGWTFECISWNRWGDALRYDGRSERGRRWMWVLWRKSLTENTTMKENAADLRWL